MSDAVTLSCPMCGAPTTSDSSCCAHCGARLATVFCPSCFGLMFEGARFCSHCGAEAGRAKTETVSHEKCPICSHTLTAIMVGNTRLKECPKGDGLWVDGVTLQQICQDREKQASVLGMGAGPVVPPAHGLEEVHYRPCPACGNLMNRVNFAGCSHVIVDVCMAHGTWCDRDELRQIVEFIRSGGLDKARSKQLAELQQRRRELNTARAVGGWSDFAPQPDKTSRGGFPGEIAADFLMALFGR